MIIDTWKTVNHGEASFRSFISSNLSPSETSPPPADNQVCQVIHRLMNLVHPGPCWEVTAPSTRESGTWLGSPPLSGKQPLYRLIPPTIPEHTAITLVQDESTLDNPPRVVADNRRMSTFCETTRAVETVDIAVKNVVSRVEVFLRMDGGVKR